MKIRGQLVSEYLENITGKAIEEYQEIIKDSIRGKNGIYALYKDGELVYVGLATDLLTRLDHHLKDRHKGKWDSFSVYISKNDIHLRELETLVMRISYPKNNRQTGRFLKAINIRDDFENAIDNYLSGIKESILGTSRSKKEKKRKNRFFKERKKDMIIVPAREEGFKKVFLGRNCWYSIRIAEEKLNWLRYIAGYQIAPTSAVTHFAKIRKIEKYKNTGKYIVFFTGKARKLRKPIKLKSGAAPMAPVYSQRELLRKAKKLADLF
jgi:hypothetical protein